MVSARPVRESRPLEFCHWLAAATRPGKLYRPANVDSASVNADGVVQAPTGLGDRPTG